MGIVDRTRASERAWRARCKLLPLLAAVACWAVSGTGGAQAAPPSAATETGAEPTPDQGSLELETSPDSRPHRRYSPGSLAWEIAGGVIPAVAGVALVVASIEQPSPGIHVPALDPSVAHTSFGVVMSLFGPAVGVAIAGNATGGTGRSDYTFVGTLGGTCWSVPGIVIGSILGYRVSADDDASDLRSSLTPVIQRHEVSLHWSGVL